MLCLALCSTLVWYNALITKACSSESSVWSIVLTYYGNTYSTSSLSRSLSHSSWLCWYWGEIEAQAKPLYVNLVSIPPYTFWHICNISSNLYKIPCIWVDRLIYVLSLSHHCKYVGIILSALSPYPLSSIFKGSTFNGNLVWTLGHFIALLMNASQGSITATNDILDLASRSLILGILVMVYIYIYIFWSVKLYCITYKLYFFFYYIFFLHFIAWLPGLIVFANFMLLFNFCLSPF